MASSFRSIFIAASLLRVLAPVGTLARQEEPKTAEKAAEKANAAPAPKEESSITEHTLKIGGQTISYKATAGTILLKNEKDEPTALVYCTSYVRTDTKEISQRPLSFLYNGGPGSASLWLHIGAFAPPCGDRGCRADSSSAIPNDGKR